MRRLTDVEAARRRALELCFKCDEKYSPTHQFKNKQLSVMLLQHVNETGEVVDSETEEEIDEVLESEQPKLASMELSMSLMAGLTNNDTMKVTEKCGGEEVIFLIDSGAPHNFVSPKLVERVGASTQDIGTYECH